MLWRQWLYLEHQDSSLTESCPSESCGWLAEQRGCYGLSENVPHRLTCLDTWSPTDDTVLRDCRLLDVGNNWRTCSPSSILSSTSSASCLLQQCHVLLQAAYAPAAMPFPYDVLTSFGLVRQGRSFFKSNLQGLSPWWWRKWLTECAWKWNFSIGVSPSAYLPSRFSTYWLTFTPIESALTPSCYLSL